MRNALGALLITCVTATVGCKNEATFTNTDTGATTMTETSSTTSTMSTETSATTSTMATTGTETMGTSGTVTTTTGTSSTSVTPAKQYTSVKIFFATDRRPQPQTAPEQRYGSERAPALTFGSAEVSIPRDHRMGNIESPSWRHFELRPDPEKHIVILSVDPVPGEPVFMDSVRARLLQLPSKEILVFIHGFNVDFGSAIKRTAQIAYDLGFQGVPVTYTWPSEAKLSRVAYVRDANAADVTAPHLRDFLVSLANRTGGAKIHIIAHSMGNKILAQALQSIALAPEIQPKPRFNEVMLTAPDIDEDVMRELSSRFAPLAQRYTMYASKRDVALIAAHRYVNSRRAGEGGPNILVLSNVDSVEASAVDTNLIGHFYYGENRSVLSDMFDLIRSDRPPSQRFGMRERRRDGGVYWAFVP